MVAEFSFRQFTFYMNTLDYVSEMFGKLIFEDVEFQECYCLDYVKFGLCSFSEERIRFSLLGESANA